MEPTNLERGAGARRRRLALALAALAALALGAPAGAVEQRRPKQPAAAPQAPGGEVPLPPPPSGTSLLSRRGWLGVAFGPLAAFDVGRASAIHLEYGIQRTPAGWRRLDLEWHLGVTLARPLGETSLTRTVIPPYGYQPVVMEAGVEEMKVWLIEVVPTARVRWTITPGIAFFGDGGVGLCQTIESYDRTEMFLGRSQRTEYVTGLALRLGVGLSADIAERWRVLLQPVAFSLQLGPKYSAFTPSLGLAFRL